MLYILDKNFRRLSTDHEMVLAKLCHSIHFSKLAHASNRKRTASCILRHLYISTT